MPRAGWNQELTINWHKGTFGDNKNILKLGYGDGYTSLQIYCKKKKSLHLQGVGFYGMQLRLQ